MRVSLAQSPFLNLVSQQDVAQTLRLMGRPPDTRITPEIGREICQRSAIKAMVHGSIASLGNSYVVTVDAVNAARGTTIAQEQSQAAGKEKVLDALGKASTTLRGKLGESLASIQNFDKPLQEATTSSLEALKMNSEAAARNNNGDFLRGIEFSKRAIELDPNFAMAYRGLAVEYVGLKSSAPTDPIISFAQLGLARALATSDKAKARVPRTRASSRFGEMPTRICPC